MPPKRKAQKRSKTSKSKRPKKSNKKSKSKKSARKNKKSTFRNKKLKKALPKIPRLSAQERAQGLSRIQKGEYEEGIHQPYVRSGKEIVINPAYLNSAAYLSGNIPINAEVDIDEMMDTTGDYRPGYEPEPDAKRQPPEVQAQVQTRLRKDKMQQLDQRIVQQIDELDAIDSARQMTEEKLRSIWADMESNRAALTSLDGEGMDDAVQSARNSLETLQDRIYHSASRNGIDIDDLEG